MIDRLFDKLADWQTHAISLLLHGIVIVLLGGTVLVHAVKELPDFEAPGGFLEDADAPELPPGPPAEGAASPKIPEVRLWHG